MVFSNPMENKVDMKRLNKRDSKKDRTDGPYSAKHVRTQARIAEIRARKKMADLQMISKCLTKTQKTESEFLIEDLQKQINKVNKQVKKMKSTL